LLVVAADSGWMPQTEEHVRVLDVIGADRGVIAITRIDLVDADTVELATLEIREETTGTSLEHWPIVPVSAITGEGLDLLRGELSTVAGSIERDEAAPFRLWVDRVFAIHGSGTVVTGTVQRGHLAIDDEVEIHPSGTTARVRGLHRHDTAVASVSVGQRAAINLSGVDVGDLERGVLLASPGTATSSLRFAMSARPTRGFDGIPPKGGFHIHSGTADRVATLRRIDDEIFVATVEDPLPIVCGDRIVIRESGRQAVVGGGPVLDPHPPDRFTRKAVAALSAQGTAADRLLELRGVASDEDLLRATGGQLPSHAVHVGTSALSAEYAERVEQAIGEAAERYHSDHPRRPGASIAEIASQVGADRAIVAWIVDHAADLTRVDGVVSAAGFSGGLSADDEQAWVRARDTLEQSYDVPRASQLGLDHEVLHAVIRRGDAIQIVDDLLFTRRQLDDLTERLPELEDGFTVSEFKDHFGMARRQSVPLLEWLDKSGLTRRVGDGRNVRKRPD
jgi:selenocysteine-specific elongation factor